MEPLPSLTSGALDERWAPLVASRWHGDGVVVFGPSWDSQVYAVAQRLVSKGAAVNVVLSDAVSDETTFGDTGRATQTRDCRSAFVRGCGCDIVPFWRDHTVLAGPDALRPSFALGRYLAGESEAARLAWVDSLHCPIIMNDPLRSAAAHKPRQLRVAQAHGIPVPRTIVTRDPAAVRSFFAKRASVVFKPLAGLVIGLSATGAHVVTPQEVSLEELGADGELLDAPAIFQERLEPVREWRVIVVDQVVLSATTEREPGVAIDWRGTEESIDSFERRRIPPDLSAALVAVVRELGLEYAAVDLIETRGGFYFLEANPDGTFWWLERSAEIPAVDAICRRLLRGESR